MKNETANDAGRYEVVLNVSNRFKNLPLLIDVVYFKGIRIHGGNTEADSKGYILIGAKLLTAIKAVAQKAEDKL